VFSCLSTDIYVTCLSTEVCVSSLSTKVCVTSWNTEVYVTSLSTGVFVTSLSTEVRKKEPFTVEMLKAIAIDAEKGNSLADICLSAACLLAFTGFLRYDEVSNIRSCDWQRAYYHRNPQKQKWSAAPGQWSGHCQIKFHHVPCCHAGAIHGYCPDLTRQWGVSYFFFDRLLLARLPSSVILESCPAPGWVSCWSRSWMSWATHQWSSPHIVSKLEEQQLLRRPVFQTAFSRDMADGSQKMLRTVMSRILWKTVVSF